MIDPKIIFWPFLAQILLTAFVYIKLLKTKRRAFAADEADRSRTPYDPSAWPPYVQQVNNNIHNQFQVPVHFLLLLVALFVLNAVDVWALAFAWIFVASRVVHMLIHTGDNVVPNRLRAFQVGVVCVVALMALTARALVM